jgi:hypothetical protein
VALLDAARAAFLTERDTDHVIAAINWVAFIAPGKAPGLKPDALILAPHTAMVGRDQRYFDGLMRLFPMIGLSH